MAQLEAQLAMSENAWHQLEAQLGMTRIARRQLEAQLGMTRIARRQLEAQLAMSENARRQLEAQLGMTRIARRQLEAQLGMVAVGIGVGIVVESVVMGVCSRSRTPAPKPNLGGVLLALVFGCVAITWADVASADTEACLRAYDDNQRQRRAGQLRAAREQLLLCSQTACPGPIQAECTRWLAQVDAALPTVVFSAQNEAGHDVTKVRVEVDGEVLVEQLDGREVAVDPGKHVVRWVDAEGVTIEQEVVFHEAVKRRLLEAKFTKPPYRSIPVPVIVHPAPPADVPPSLGPSDSKPSIPTEAWVFGGIGAAGLASFGYFGWRAWSETDDLEQRCAPNCPASDVDAARNKALVADISLGIAVLGAAGAIYFVLVEPGEETAVELKAAAGPGWAGLRGAF